MVFGQTEMDALLNNVETISFPFTTEQGLNTFRGQKKTLKSSDRSFIIEKLNNKLPRTINPYGNSPFGQIDCLAPTTCDKLENLKGVSILWFYKLSENNYLLHLEFEKEGQFGLMFGALLSMNKEGELIDWFFSDGSVNGGNPNGNVSRNFTIQKDTSILIEETSWGRNTIAYSFKCRYKLTTNDQNNLSDYLKGEFDLKSLSIDY